MSGPVLAPHSLEDAKLLVTLVDNGDNGAARKLLDSINYQDSIQLFAELGKLTHQLHNALNKFQCDKRIVSMVNEVIPDTQSRLIYVIETTEKAANKTMDLVNSCMPIQLELGGITNLCHQIDSFLLESVTESTKLNDLLTEVLMAQGYQDLTGQVIRRVIEGVKEVADNLIKMLTIFAGFEGNKSANKMASKADSIKAEGPILYAAAREDIASYQDDVDDLLSGLEFLGDLVNDF